MASDTLIGVNGREVARRPLRKDAERNRKRVIAAARELFAVHGLESTLNEVAHHAGLGVGTVYRRFPTKESLFEAIYVDGMDQLSGLAEAALRHENSWEGFEWFVHQMCEITATNRGLREIAFSKAHGGDHVEAGRARLLPLLSKVVERAQKDGYLRPEASATDMPFFGVLTGAVSEFAGEVNADLWRRYMAILIEGMRRRDDQERLEVDALDEAQIDAAMTTWQPAGSG